MATNATIGALRVVLGLDSANFTKGLRGAQRHLKRIGGQMKTIGRTMSFALTAPIILIGASIIKTASDFEAGMNRVRGVLKPTEAEFIKLTDLAKELGRTTQFTATQVVDGMEILGKNSLRATAILEGALEASLDLAGALGGPLKDSADVITDVLINFGLATSDLPGIVDKVTGAVLSSKLGWEGFAAAVGKAAGTAGPFGVSFEDMVAVIALTASSFASGEEAGTSFRGFLTKLAPTGAKAIKLMKDLGINSFTASGDMKTMADVSEELKVAFKDLTKEQTIQAADILFGQRKSKTALRLMEVGAEGINKMKDAINEFSAAAQRQIRLQGFAGAMLLLMSALEGLKLTIAEAGFLEFLTDLAESLTEIVRKLSNSSKSFFKWGTIIAGLVAVAGPLIFTLGLLINGIVNIGPVLTIAVKAFVGLRAALIVMSAPLIAFLGPWGLIAGAVVLIAIKLGLLGKAFDNFFPNAIKMVDDFSTAFIKNTRVFLQWLGVLARPISFDLSRLGDQLEAAQAETVRLKAEFKELMDTQGFNVAFKEYGDLIRANGEDVDRLTTKIERLNLVRSDLTKDPVLPEVSLPPTSTKPKKVFTTGDDDPFGDILKSLKDQAFALELRADAVGLNTGAMEEFLASEEAFKEAIDEGLVLSEKQTLAFEDAAKRIGDAAADLEKREFLLNLTDSLKEEAEELRFRASLIGLNTEETIKLVIITQAMNEAVRVGIKLSDDQIKNLEKLAAGVAEASEEFKKAREEQANLEGIAEDFVDPLKDALKEGEISFQSFADTLVAIASRLRDRMIDELFDPIEDAIIKMLKGAGGAGGIGGLLGSIGTAILGGLGSLGGGGGVGSGTAGAFANLLPGGSGRVGGGREHGGPVRKGQAVIVGEKRPELFVPDVSGKILPRVPAGDISEIPAFAHGADFIVGGSPGIDNNIVQFKASRGERVQVTPTGKSSGGGLVVNINQPIDARGAVEGTAQQITRALIENNKRLPGMVREATRRTQ